MRSTLPLEYLNYFQCARCEEYFRRGDLTPLPAEEATAAKLMIGELMRDICFGCAVIEEGENCARS